MKKIYCELNNADEYLLYSILLLMNKNISAVNKVFAQEFFRDSDILKIIDLTYKNNLINVRQSKKNGKLTKTFHFLFTYLL
jgi:hypothetical protein